MKHKKYLILPFVFLISGYVFAGPITAITNSLQKQNWTVFDTPLFNGIGYFISTFFFFF